MLKRKSARVPYALVPHLRRRTKLYFGARGSPGRVFMRAASEDPLEASTYSFLLDHVDELDLNVLVAMFGARLAHDVEVAEKPFVRRLVQLVPSANASQLLHVLKLSARISAEAWSEDLTLPLRGKLPNYQWYRFVDKARGGAIFNALNVGMPRPAHEPNWNPDEMFVTSIEEVREEPIVVGLLDRAHDDLAAAEFARNRLPVLVLLQLQEAFPNLVTLDCRHRSPEVPDPSESPVPGSGGSGHRSLEVDPLRDVSSVCLGEPYQVDRMLFSDDRASRVCGPDPR
jgi:hypothetical protein